MEPYIRTGKIVDIKPASHGFFEVAVTSGTEYNYGQAFKFSFYTQQVDYRVGDDVQVVLRDPGDVASNPRPEPRYVPEHIKRAKQFAETVKALKEEGVQDDEAINVALNLFGRGTL